MKSKKNPQLIKTSTLNILFSIKIILKIFLLMCVLYWSMFAILNAMQAGQIPEKGRLIKVVR